MTFYKTNKLINKLKKLPKTYDVRIDYNLSYDDTNIDDIRLTNYWVDSIEFHEKGSSGYECNGEVVILGGE